MKNTQDIHAHELDVGTTFGNYRVIQQTKTNLIAEHIRTGELARFDYVEDKLVYRNH